jgi:hypothetical protein
METILVITILSCTYFIDTDNFDIEHVFGMAVRCDRITSRDIFTYGIPVDWFTIYSFILD